MLNELIILRFYKKLFSNKLGFIMDLSLFFIRLSHMPWDTYVMLLTACLCAACKALHIACKYFKCMLAENADSARFMTPLLLAAIARRVGNIRFFTITFKLQISLSPFWISCKNKYNITILDWLLIFTSTQTYLPPLNKSACVSLYIRPLGLWTQANEAWHFNYFCIYFLF